MISVFAAIATVILVLIPSVPLFIYVIGLLLPEKHNVSHSATYANTTVENVWGILANVQEYPSWQPTLDREKCTKEENDGMVVYTEHTKRNKYISTVVSVDSEPHQVLLRKTEEDSSISSQRQKPTFIGTWTYTVESQGDGSVKVTIVEDGTITRPMVRLLHVALLGYQRHIDRFLRDLGKKIQEDVAATKDEQKVPMTTIPTPPHNETDKTEQEDAQGEEEAVEAKETNMTAEDSPTMEKDWDLMSEIYQRPNAHG